MSHPSPNSDFHYHFWSPCLKKNLGWWSDSESPPLCRDQQFCTTHPSGFARNFSADGLDLPYTKDNWDDVIGIARDGHMIIGPYDQDGSVFFCDRDVCNGKFIDGSYVYVGSDQFPYVVGCWGPGPAPLYQPGCTSNGCGALLASAVQLISASISLGAATILSMTVF